MATTKIITIHRNNLTHEKALKLAKAFVTIAGESEVEITLRGPWAKRQSCIVLKTPCHAAMGLDSFEAMGGAEVRTDGYGATVDLKITMPITANYKEA